MYILAYDHNGYELMHEIKDYFDDNNISFLDVSKEDFDEKDDYPEFAKLANDYVKKDPENIGIYACGTGMGMCMVANRDKAIRACNCFNEDLARLARKHNDANVLVLPAKFLNCSQAISIIKMFEDSHFEGGRHKTRLDMFS